MLKPRVLPIMISAVLSVAVLFGGWAIYNHVAVSAPLNDAIKEVPGLVDVAKPSIEQDYVRIAVQLSDDANLRQVYENIAENGKAAIGDRKLELQIDSSSSAELDELWNQVLFEVAEAMETKAYSNIPKAMELAAGRYQGVSATTEMDGSNIYITMKQDKAAKYVVLPRTPAKLGVWPNA